MQGDTSPASRGVAVTPSDVEGASFSAPFVVRCLWIGTGGNVAVRLLGDKANTPALVLKNVASGTALPLYARGVMATGTTATDIVALGS